MEVGTFANLEQDIPGLAQDGLACIFAKNAVTFVNLARHEAHISREYFRELRKSDERLVVSSAAERGEPGS